jgi:hypothetical protein
MSAKRPKFSYPVPANNRGHAFSTAEELLAKLGGESSGQYLVGSQGMWHGGIHITDATIPWCALSARTEAEQQYRREPYQGEQFIRCMADGDIVAWRVCKDYQSAAIPWREENLYMSTSLVLVRHAIQLGDTAASGLTFYTLYMNLAPFSAYTPQGGEQGRRTAGVQRYYNSADDVRAGNSAGKLIADTQVMLTDGVVTRRGDQRQFSKVVLLKKTVTAAGGILAAGSTVWTVSDQGALIAEVSALSPRWWRQCVPAYGPQPAGAVKASQPVFGEVVIPPVPIAINAGDNIGHLGFYQLPEENGKRSRYQAHIECLSMDANLPDFLRNPDQVGEQEPAYLKYPQAAPLFVKNFEGQMVDSTRKTRTQGIATLFKVPVEKIDGQPAYYRIYRENGWLAAASVRKLSQYALAELGFITLDKAPESFDLIDGSTHPDNVVKGILERLYKAAQDETRTSHALNQYNYKRLLEMIDSQRDGHYSEKEYLQAVHNVSYRDYLYRIIVKHASEWYYGKDDPLWKTYLDTLTLDAPQWKTYIEALIDNMTWMKKVDGMGPEPWHMHPVVFLSSLLETMKTGWAHSPFAHLLGSVESKNDYSAYNVTKTGQSVPYYHTKLTSMSVFEVMESQRQKSMFAVGRFQIIPSTLKEAVNTLNLDTSQLYDEIMQDKIFEEYLIKIKRPAFIKYLEENGNVEDAIYDWAKEFASAGVRKGKKISPKREVIKDENGRPKLNHGKKMYRLIPRVAGVEGESYYAGDGFNRAHILPDSMVKTLMDSKNAI